MTRARSVKNVKSVKDVMNPDVMTVADDMTTDELARYLIEHEISGAPVVDGQGHLVGVVSMTDIGRHLAELSETAASGAESLRGGTSADPTLEDLGQLYVEDRPLIVRDVMTPAVHQVPVTASVAAAARIMVEHHIHRLVVTEDKQPVGMVTSIDLLRMVAERA